jgi:hypothetical protein
VTMRGNVGLLNTILDSGLKTAFDTDGRINIYTGAQPATADLAPTGTLLGTLTMANPGIAAAAAAVSAWNAITSDTAADTGGTAGWGRVYKNAQGPGVSTTNPHLDFAIPADVDFDNEAFTLNGIIAISGLSLSLANWL